MAFQNQTLVVALLATLALASCGDADRPATPDGGGSGPVTEAALTSSTISTPRLSGGASSPTALVSQALVALMTHDTATLVGLLVTRDEFDRLLYPEMGKHYPAARDTSALARQFIWENQANATRKGLLRALRDLSGRRMDLIGVGFNEGRKSFDSYTILEGTRVRVRTDDSHEMLLTQLGSIVEMDGRYKLMSYRERE